LDYHVPDMHEFDESFMFQKITLLQITHSLLRYVLPTACSLIPDSATVYIRCVFTVSQPATKENEPYALKTCFSCIYCADDLIIGFVRSNYDIQVLIIDCSEWSMVFLSTLI